MEIEIKIGKEESGANAITVPQSCKRVSRHHAKLLWKDGVVTIEDNESTNGTFVNGKRIARTKVDEEDTVWLGGNNGGAECFQLDMKTAFTKFRDIEWKARTDFSEEFQAVAQTYIDYQTEVAKVKTEYAKSSQMPKLIVSMVPAVIGLVICISPALKNSPEAGTWRAVTLSAGTVISGIVGFLTMGKSNQSNDKMNETITEIQIKYQKKYCCPKCGKEFPITTHWKKLLADGKCPNPKCNAKYVKENDNCK